MDVFVPWARVSFKDLGLRTGGQTQLHKHSRLIPSDQKTWCNVYTDLVKLDQATLSLEVSTDTPCTAGHL